jgi:hypothetical protein
MSTTISRLYNSYGDARAVVRQLELAGVAHSDISIIASNADNWYNNGKDTFPDRDLNGKDDRAEATGTGAAIGAAAGGAVGLLTGLGLMAIPGVGPVVAAGWLVATLAGAAYKLAIAEKSSRTCGFEALPEIYHHRDRRIQRAGLVRAARPADVGGSAIDDGHGRRTISRQRGRDPRPGAGGDRHHHRWRNAPAHA